MAFRKNLTLSFLFCCFLASLNSLAQNNSLQAAEKNLAELLNATRSAKIDSVRLELNKQFNTLLAESLSLPESNMWPFDSLNIGKLNSADGKIRIFNWNIQQNDRTNLYSMIVFNVSKNKIITLKNQSPIRVLDENTIFRNGEWPGGLIYRIIERKEGHENLYTLLAWHGIDPEVNRKTIEALSFDQEGVPVFGAPVFKTKNGVRNRVVNEYSAGSAFTQNYDRQKITLSNVRKSKRKIDDQMIVLDRLVPLNESLEGQRWAYVSAGNIYDAYIFIDKFWTFVEDISPRNPEVKGKQPAKKQISYELFPPQ
ncbi:MAG: hypothetical protein K0B15_07105 [Lentimicrobium sp.]|nr:hypothetical protein [Lentimicrobium sp.]